MNSRDRKNCIPPNGAEHRSNNSSALSVELLNNVNMLGFLFEVCDLRRLPNNERTNSKC